MAPGNQKTLEELTKSIENEVPYIDIKPFSHNIISLILRQVSQKYGKDEVNAIMIKYNLVSMGWRLMD